MHFLKQGLRTMFKSLFKFSSMLFKIETILKWNWILYWSIKTRSKMFKSLVPLIIFKYFIIFLDIEELDVGVSIKNIQNKI